MKKTEIRRGDIFSYDFGTRIGSIQSGVRPVLVIQADNFNANAPTVIVASITSVIKKRYLPSHIILGEDFGLTKPSMVLLEQRPLPRGWSICAPLTRLPIQMWKRSLI